MEMDIPVAVCAPAAFSILPLFLREMTTGECWIQTAKNKPTTGDSKIILFAGVKEELTAATLKLLPR